MTAEPENPNSSASSDQPNVRIRGLVEQEDREADQETVEPPTPGAEPDLPSEREPVQSEKPKRMGVVGATSKQAGAAVGTAAAVGGKVAGAGAGALAAVGRSLRASARLLRFRSAREKIRSIVIEELARVMGGEAELTRSKLDERMRVMAQTLVALQERVNQLSTQGPVSSADLMKEIGSLEVAAPLTDDERAVLASVFRQNIALQKPELADAPADDREAQ